MSQHTLQRLVGTAIVDRRFCHDFLNGGRRRLLAEFEVSPEEEAAILAIRADSLEGFATELQLWLKGRQQPPTVPLRYTPRTASLPLC
jgi:hypothetical protein